MTKSFATGFVGRAGVVGRVGVLLLMPMLAFTFGRGIERERGLDVEVDSGGGEGEAAVEYLRGLFGVVVVVVVVVVDEEGWDCGGRRGERGWIIGVGIGGLMMVGVVVEVRSLEVAGEEEDGEPKEEAGPEVEAEPGDDGDGSCGTVMVESTDVRGGEFFLTRGWCLSWGRKSSDGRELVTVDCVWSCGLD